MGKLLHFFSVLAAVALVAVVGGIGIADEIGAKDQKRTAELQKSIRKEVKVIQGKDGQTLRVETIVVGDEGDADEEDDAGDEVGLEAKIKKRIETKFLIDGDGIDVRLEKGKLIIRLPDGTEQKIDLPVVDGAELPELKVRDIELDFEVEGSNKPQKADLDIDVQAKGKAIIVDSDGNVREIELGPDAIVGEGAIIGGPGFSGVIESGVLKVPVQLGEYMIGVGINDASPALRSQLSLDEGTGVVVSYVGDDSPAAKAGIEMFDVIVSAGDRVIHNLSELIDVVNANGEKEQAIAFTLIRKGEKKTIEVTPVKRPAGEIQDATIGGFPGFEAIPQAGFGKHAEILERLEKRIKQFEKRLEQLESE